MSLADTGDAHPQVRRTTASAAPAATPAAGPGFERPAADHHKHLPSAAAARLISAETLPPVTLPEDLARLVRERVRAWNDTTALARLYAEDGAALDPRAGAWVQGRSAVAAQVARQYDRPYQITPTGYGVRGSSSYVTGYLTRGTAASPDYFATVRLALEKDGDGAWRIAAETPTFPGPERQDSITAEQLVAQLDSAGIRRGVVLSVAYWFGSPRFQLADEYAKVRAENDWTARQVARYPDRLVGFCSFNPLKDYAIAELNRCVAELHLTGLKIHFGSSRIDVLNPEHVRKLRTVFREANRLRMPIVVHVRGYRATQVYGREHAQVFLDQLLPEAPDVPVQVAHLWGGAEYSPGALAVFADAVAARDPRTRNLWFDVTDIVSAIRDSDDAMIEVVRRMRQIGLGRLLWGSDMSPPGAAPRQAWLEFRAMPLTNQEFGTIAANLAPYLR